MVQGQLLANRPERAFLGSYSQPQCQLLCPVYFLLGKETLNYDSNMVLLDQLDEDFDETDDTFKRDIKDDCFTFIYRMLFIFYAESREDLDILPANDPIYTKGYSLEIDVIDASILMQINTFRMNQVEIKQRFSSKKLWTSRMHGKPLPPD